MEKNGGKRNAKEEISAGRRRRPSDEEMKATRAKRVLAGVNKKG